MPRGGRMMTHLLFSVVIPAYNYGHLLERAVSSVLQQTGNDFELLVINDGSTDNTQEILAALHKKYPYQFSSTTIKNSGLAAVRNYGIDHTQGKFFIFLDADDELLPNALNAFRAAIAQQSSKNMPGMIVGGHIAVFPNGQKCILKSGYFSKSKENNFKCYLINKNIRLSNGALIMHRRVFKKYRYLEQFRNSEDIPVFAYILANFHCISVKDIINKVYKHPNSLRYNHQYAIDVAEKIIDEVFDENRIPLSLQKYKKKYTAKRNLSLFKTFYSHKDYPRAQYYYFKAIKNNWLSVLNISNTKKIFISLIKFK